MIVTKMGQTILLVIIPGSNRLHVSSELLLFGSMRLAVDVRVHGPRVLAQRHAVSTLLLKLLNLLLGCGLAPLKLGNSKHNTQGLPSMNRALVRLDAIA